MAPGPGPVAASDRQAPALTKVTLSRSRFAVGSGVTARSARRAPVGTSIRFTVSEAATVRITVARRSAGRRSGRRCVKPTAKLRRRARCVLVVSVVTLTRRVAAGRRSVPFSGRFSRRSALKLGGHQMRLRATDAAGNTSAAKVLRFTIVRR